MIICYTTLNIIRNHLTLRYYNFNLISVRQGYVILHTLYMITNDNSPTPKGRGISCTDDVVLSAEEYIKSSALLKWNKVRKYQYV